MNFDEEREQHGVETKYSDPEHGIKIELRKDKLYKLRKSTKIVKPTKEVESPFDTMDHANQQHAYLTTDIILDECDGIYMTEEMMREMLEESESQIEG